MNACRKMTSEEVPINWRSSLMRSFPTCRHISRESSMKRIQEQAVHHQGIEHFCDHLFNQWKQLSEDEKKKGRETRLQTSQHSSSTVARVTVVSPFMSFIRNQRAIGCLLIKGSPGITGSWILNVISFHRVESSERLGHKRLRTLMKRSSLWYLPGVHFFFLEPSVEPGTVRFLCDGI